MITPIAVTGDADDRRGTHGVPGINLQGAYNTALQTVGSEIPAPLVAQMLGYTTKLPSSTRIWLARRGPTTWRDDLNGERGFILRSRGY